MKAILAEQGGKGGGSDITLTKIEITTQPTKKSYIAGEAFDPTGMIVTASYGMGNAVLTTAEVGGYTYSPQTLTDGVTKVVVTYSEFGVTCTADVPVTVIHALTSISVTTNPTKMTYEYGDAFVSTGAIVTAKYSDNQTKTVTGTWESKTFNTLGSQDVKVSYTENGITKDATISVTVNRKVVAKPTWKADLPYNKNSQSVTSTARWNNYNTTYMNIGGTTSATNAGTYTAKFTCGANYRFDTSNTTEVNVNWKISQIDATITPSVTTLALDASNLTKTFTVTKDTSGALSATVSPTTGVTVSVNGTTVTVTGNGTTAGTFKITLQTAADTNYKATTKADAVSVTATYWSWGSETGTADTAWWSGLKSWIGSATTSELSACVGKTKSVTLTTAVLGTTTHLVRCIGYNCNRDKNNTTRNTLTFETANALATNTVFGSSNGKWTGSTVRQQCINYYNAFPGKASVATVSIGTATTTNSSQNGTPTYTDETVFLASDAEHGFPAGHDYNSGKGYSASYDEFDKFNTSKTPYQYCTSNANRIKKQGDNGSAQYYWERSLFYDDENRACRVNTDGQPTGSYYTNSAGLAPAFVI